MTHQEKTPFVSVIIPVYNVEPYIERCFGSVLSQSYRNYEVIFVDDCGTDKSIEILQQLIERYEGDIPLKIIHHEQNRGLSASRNSGVSAAEGDYLFFLDSDDFIFPDTLSSLVNPLNNKRFDLVAGRSLVRKKGKEFPSDLVFSEGKTVFQCVYDGMASAMGISSTVCNHLYRTDFLKQNNIRFREGILFEDILFSVEFFCHDPVFVELDQITYFYDIRENSITTTSSEKHYNDNVRGCELLEQIITEHHLLDAPYARLLIGQRYLRLLIIASDFGKGYFERTLNYLRKRGFRRDEYSAMKFRHKLLYLQNIMPKPLAYIYSRSVVLFYGMISQNSKK